MRPFNNNFEVKISSNLHRIKGTELMKSFKVRELIYLQARNFVQRALRDFRDTRNDFYVVYRLYSYSL